MSRSRAPSRGSTATPRRRNRKGMILRAAGDLFRQHGYHSVDMHAIGAAAGISGPAIYTHFHGKAHLLAALVEQALESIERALERAEQVADPHEAVECLVSALVRLALEESYLAQLDLQESHRFPDTERARLARLRNSVFRRQVALLQRLRPDLGEDELRFRVFTITNGLIGSASWAGLGMNRDAQSALLERMALSALLVNDRGTLS